MLDLLRARTRRFDVVFVLGLEEGSLPRRSRTSPFLDDDARRELGGRLERPDQVSRDRYLFYTACTRATRRLYLVREAATDDGAPREPSPFWEEVAAVFDAEDVAHATSRRPLSALTWPLEAAPSERERLRALAQLVGRRSRRRPARSPTRTTGSGGSHARSTALRRETRLTSDGAARGLRREDDLRRHRARALRRLLVGVALRAHRSRRGRSTPRSTRCCAARSRTARCTSSTRGCRRSSATTASRRRTSSGRSASCGAASTTRCAAACGSSSPSCRRPSSRRASGATSRASSATRPTSPLQLAPAPLRGRRSAPTARRPSCSAACALGDGLHLSGKIDRIDVDPFSARGIVQDYKSGRTAHSAKQIDEELKLQIPLYMLVLRDLVGIEPLGGVYRALAGARVTRGLLHAGASDDLPGFQRNDYLRGGRVLVARRDRARPRARLRAAHPRRRRAPRPEGRRRARPGATSGRCAGSSARERPSSAQRSRRRGEVFVSAGAGTGKTTVLVERFVRAVCEQGLDVESVLVITYTRKAAGELRARIRAALHARGRHDLARRLDGAWISTIHGFCSRLLRAHPFAVGIDPRFRELDDEHGAVHPRRGVRARARGVLRDARLASGCGCSRPTARRACAGCSPASTRRFARPGASCARARRAGGRPRAARRAARRGARARRRSRRDREAACGGERRARAQARTPSSCSTSRSSPRRGDRAAEFRGARDRLEQAAFDELAARDSELLQELLDLFAAEYAAAKQRESALDFEDLQLLRARPAARRRGGPRGGAAALPRDHGRRVPGHEPPAVRHRRPAARRRRRARRVLRRRRVPVDLRLPPRRRRRLPRAARARRRSACRSRGTTARGPRCSPPSTISSARSSATATSRSPRRASSPIRCSAIRSSCSSPTSAATARRARAGATARRGRSRAACASSSTPASPHPGEIVLLFAAGTDAERYEAALRAQGLPTYRATGRGYFGQQQVVDLLVVPAPAAQPLRRRGARHRARLAVRRRLERRARARSAGTPASGRSTPGSSARCPRRSPRTTSGSCARSSSATSGWSPPPRGSSLERLCEEIVSAHDYDLAVLARGTASAATRTCAS